MLEDQAGELMEGGELQVEVGGGQDEALHFKKVLDGVQTITEVYVFLSFKSVDLVVFWGNEKSSYAQELKVLLRNDGTLEKKKIVNYLHTDLNSLVFHLKLPTDLHQPFQENFPHFSADLGLPEVFLPAEGRDHQVCELLIIVDEMLNNAG